MAEQLKTEQPKKSGLKKWLIGGTLTALAAVAFVAAPFHTAGHANPAPTPHAKVAKVVKGKTVPSGPVTIANGNVQVVQDGNTYPATSKDRKVLSVEVAVPVLKAEGSRVTPEVFANGLQGFMTINVMQELSKYNEADIAANIPQIQGGLSKFLADNMILGVDNSGKPIKAQEGLNYGKPTITQVKDAATGTVLYQAKVASGPLSKLGL